jgi:molybdate/tungstate transport system substrate-binding protein
LKRSVDLLIIFIIFLIACNNSEKSSKNSNNSISGNLIIFHAGSLSVPMKEITSEFKKENPGINILMESAGSIECARKITELKLPCDVLASSDYKVIDKLLIPDFADWNIKFASNEMALVFTEKSRKCKEINKDNWYKILLDKNIKIARADPNTDPCGYRTVIVIELAEKYYKQNRLAKSLLQKDENNMRPKETDLLSLLESGDVDYIFIYRSVAEQHNLKYLLLPDEINLKKPEFSDLYNSVSVEIKGKKPNEKIIQKGEAMIYGITILKDSPDKAAALAFVKFLLSKEQGMKILERFGQPSVIPCETSSYDNLPEELKSFATRTE